MGHGAFKGIWGADVPGAVKPNSVRKIWSIVPDRPDRFYKQKRYDKFRELPDAAHPVWSVAVAEVAMILAAAVAGNDVEVHMWSLEDPPELMVSLHAHTANVWQVLFSPNETVLATASADTTIRIWQTGTGHPLAVLQGHEHTVRCLSFSFDGLLVSGGMDSNLGLWQHDQLIPLRLWQAHEGSVHGVAFSPADTLLCFSVGHDGSIAAWNTAAVVHEGEEHGLLGRFPLGFSISSR